MAKLNLNKQKLINEDNLRAIISYGLGFASRVKTLEDKEIAPFEANKMYLKDSLCIYNDYIYMAKVTNQSATFNENYWTLLCDDITELSKTDIEAMLGLTTEEIETLSKIILDTEVRLDKTWSSSKIYTDIQNAIDTSKAYTLAELGKASGASYKVVSSTGDMTEQKYIYLMSDGASSYNMYIVESDGTATRIGDTTINLDNYFTKTEITDNYYDKATSDGKFATVTTVDNHKDDTDIHITSNERTKWNNATNEEKVKEIVDSEMTTKGVCTKSVADVAKTIITPSEDASITLNNSCTYTVINGICYVSLWGYLCTTTGQHVLSTSLPKSKVVAMGMCSYGSVGNIGACIFVRGDNTGSLYAEVNKTGDPLYGGFSYPVAE